MVKLVRFLMIAMACMPVVLWAADDDRYLAGAVPEVDGKIVFTKEFNLPGVNQQSIYEHIYNWLDSRMKANGNGSRITYSDKEKGQIVASGEEYLLFSNTALSLDRSLMSYNFVILCEPEKCEMQVERIRYTYEDDKYTAEEQISDKVALNKKQTAIFRGYRKFRVKTIDYVNDLFDSARMAFGLKDENTKEEIPSLMASQSQQVAATTTIPVNIQVTSAVGTDEPETVAPAVQSATSVVMESVLSSATVEGSAFQGYRSIAPDKIPGNIIKMLGEDWMLITAGTDQKFNMMTASWGGLGRLYEKPVAICFINPLRYTYQLMEANDTYTITFYTEAYREALTYCGSNSGRDADKVKGSGLTPVTTPSGSKAFSEAWLIIECRKLVGQSLNHEALYDEKTKSEWMGKQLHKMYIGEIINVWVK